MSFEKQEVISTHFYAFHIFQLQSQPTLVKRCLLLTHIHEQCLLRYTTFGDAQVLPPDLESTY
jgi:hypothetical protein